MRDMAAYQTDYLSLPARQIVPYAKDFYIQDSISMYAAARNLMINFSWDYKLEAGSIAAAIYVEWEALLRQFFKEAKVPNEAKGMVSPPMSRVLEWVHESMTSGADEKLKGLVESAFAQAVKNLEQKLGSRQLRRYFIRELPLGTDTQGMPRPVRTRFDCHLQRA